ncbi:MAG: ubiquinol-cytochrome c reductase iron-sulfur subunit [Gemmatimonadales bacterium]|nr:MAG: ubiquinol-cytochrome c reductase iron-sulfur subunit [Gemmatimonadales bacterium]
MPTSDESGPIPTSGERAPPSNPPDIPETAGDPAAAGNPDKGECGPCEERRRLLTFLTLGIGSAAGASLLAPWLGLFVTPLTRTDPTEWRDVGSLEDFPVGRTLRVTYRDPEPLPWAGYAARNAAWVRRDGSEEFAAFTTYCTHVGCAVRWEEGARLFLCPCHGGAFYADGSVAAGPPPRPLDRYPIRIRDGRVEIRTEGIPDPRG